MRRPQIFDKFCTFWHYLLTSKQSRRFIQKCLALPEYLNFTFIVKTVIKSMILKWHLIEIRPKNGLYFLSLALYKWSVWFSILNLLISLITIWDSQSSISTSHSRKKIGILLLSGCQQNDICYDHMSPIHFLRHHKAQSISQWTSYHTPSSSHWPLPVSKSNENWWYLLLAWENFSKPSFWYHTCYETWW